MSSILTWEQSAKIANQLKESGKTLVTTNGCFDLLHRGHVAYLEQSKMLGDYLLVGINSDSSVKKLKGVDRPINNQEDRAYVLSALSCVDAVCIFNEDTPVKWLEQIKPKIHVKGGDYKISELPETQALKSWGGEIRIINFVEGYSTSNTLEKMKK